jgi:3-hydroxybutyryl-CoA dehydrogenase
MAVKITRVGVIGAGIMGTGITEVCLRSGVDTVMLDVAPEFVERGLTSIQKSLDAAVKRGRLDSARAGDAMAHLDTTTDLSSLAECDLVIEAATENEVLKIKLFGDLDEVLGPEAIIASNTSSIPIIKLGRATRRPGRVLGMHFFNPAPVQQLVELIPSLATDAEVVNTVEEFVTETLGKKTIHCRDQAGFVVNALLVPYLLAAIRMVESGTATANDIDEGMKNGCAHPMGPLALCDLVGLDTVHAVAEVMFDEFKEPLYASPPLLKRMVAAGWLGRKSGHGFYNY